MSTPQEQNAASAKDFVDAAFSKFDDVSGKAQEYLKLDAEKKARLKAIDGEIAGHRLTEKGKVEKINACHSGPLAKVLVNRANMEATEQILPLQLEATSMFPAWQEGLVPGIERGIKKGLIVVASAAGSVLKAPLQGISEGFNLFKKNVFGKNIDVNTKTKF